ncbi:zinc-dependent alcohol dehydrogenase [Tengunoibacter tsumagoiensis]|uniref:Glutathione-dependent formaldehyde dehydrogenase n=1 Tax=Tengunoibacter tsumagoiensis TaxID=2014871 RepID=A0A402AAG1_9CHLR|nr:zinc-dependent alcohol dehydrogenase [Tengunoibacter tsumagoiensis]GCE15911.1 glutathione-dependent formaldehyde dehydrogenase [Tengunoibacter tsumagoiensis]
MKAVVFHGVGDIRLDDVTEPKLQEATDAIVRITGTAICGTDLHLVRGTEAGMEPNTILGHEAIGVVEQIGSNVKEIQVGDRVVVTSSITCGTCEKCQAGRYDLCLKANPNGPRGATAFFGGPKTTGSFQGLQAEKARIPFADNTLIKLPNSISDEQAILLSDIFPTAYYGAELAEIKAGNVVAIFGCGPVGLATIMCAQLLGAGRIFAVDTIPSRLEKARELGAEVIDYNAEDPVKAIKRFTDQIGADRVIDAVGVDANRPHHGLHKLKSAVLGVLHKSNGHNGHSIQQESNPQGDNWHPGDAPGRALSWGVEATAKAGTFSIIGVYPEVVQEFPLGMAMNRNITVTMGHCPHRKYIPHLIELVTDGVLDPTVILTEKESLTSAIDAYKAFDERQPGWIKVMLQPAMS